MKTARVNVVVAWIGGVVFVISANCSSLGSAANTEWVYDVVPLTWVTADGEHLPTDGSKSGDARAFIFPSLKPDDETGDMHAFTTRNAFFLQNNRFPQADSFYWPNKKTPFVTIEVERMKGSPSRATFRVRSGSLTQIRHLSWREVRCLQKDFQQWLLWRSGCLFLGDRKKRFGDFDDTLGGVWRDHILEDATFAIFAERYLNTHDFCIKYPGSAFKARMKATPLFPRQQLSISWGTTAVYPFKKESGILGGYTRLAAGGQTELQISAAEGGLSLFSPGTTKLETVPMDPQSFDPAKVNLPFPISWAGLFGSVFVPIYNPLDLLDGQLLRRTDAKGNKRTPHYLFLLSPKEYIKADSDVGATNLIAQFATDAREGVDQSQASAPQLARRFIIVGCDTPAEPAVQHELERLIDAAADASENAKNKEQSNGNGNKTATEEGYPMAVFAHQSSVTVGCHISFNGHPFEKSTPHLETWGGVIATAKLSLLATPAKPGFSPAVVICRTICTTLGVPKYSMRIRFHTTTKGVFDCATVGEGDEFITLP